MQQPGLDQRHRDKDGTIARKHGNTLIGTRRRIYGENFAGGSPTQKSLATCSTGSTMTRSRS